MLNTNKQHIRHLAEICYQKGVTQFVISPGSRSAPLVIALARHQHIHTISIIDERSAAFFALGMAQQLQQPVALVCTSGSAVLNYAPALAEAYYQKIPLLVFTADRPHEWINQQDGQAIVQKSVFENYILKSFELPSEPKTETDIWYSDRIINEAINIAITQQGPVHVNIPLREPLYEQLEVTSIDTPKIIRQTLNKNTETVLPLSKGELGRGDKILILCGNGTFNFSAYNLAQFSNCVFLSEINCNTYNETFHHNLDALVNAIPNNEKEKFDPDLLITFGGAIVSKKMKDFLRSNPPKQHWHLSKHHEHTDTFQCLTHVVNANIFEVLGELENLITKKNGFQEEWNNLAKKVKAKQDLYLSNAPFSDFKAYQNLTSKILLLKSVNLHLGNSTPVRYAAYFNWGSNTQINSNRGVSGIDGTVSTAAGAAFVNQKPTVLITGDIAFMYDSNGLWNKQLPANLIVIVINNQGGNIFRLINNEETLPELNEYFETPQPYSVEYIAKAFDITYYFCDSETTLDSCLKTIFEPSSKPVVLEVKTDGRLSAQVFKDFTKQLKQP
jgi:2-succinyl-5-enolpyruvyl-6-hydroxy-3-cyclohexene-1-carboxylate synthase